MMFLTFFTTFCFSENGFIIEKVKDGNKKGNLILTIKSEGITTKFYKSIKEPKSLNFLQLHLPFIIEKIIENKKKFNFDVDNLKYIIKPFNEINIYENGKKIVTGKYKKSEIEDNSLVQYYSDNGMGFFNNTEDPTVKVKFIGSIENLKLEKQNDKKSRIHEITVSGSIFTEKILCDTLIEYENDEIEKDSPKTSDEVYEDYKKKHYEWEKEVSLMSK